MVQWLSRSSSTRPGATESRMQRSSTLLDNAWTVVPDQGEWDLDMYLGPGSDGLVYEVGVAYDDEGHLIVIHAMPMRPMYEHHLDDFRK